MKRKTGKSVVLPEKRKTESRRQNTEIRSQESESRSRESGESEEKALEWGDYGGGGFT
jgi:hypothetical protein